MRVEIHGSYLHLDEHRRPFGEADRTVLAELGRAWDEAAGPVRYDARLPEIGNRLYRWLDGDQGWGALLQERAADELIELCAPPSEPAFLDAPWEILRDPSRPPSGGKPLQDAAFLVRGLRCWPVRRVQTGKRARPRPPSPHALSLLFMAASPEGQTRLAFEAEEAAITRAVQGIELDCLVEESGELYQLALRLARLQPVDVLHLSCHGQAGASPVLLLEDEAGAPAPCTVDQLLAELSAHARGLGLCLLSACQTATGSPVGPMARSLVERGVPAVLGWAANVHDAEASSIAAHLYGHLARGLSPAVALREGLSAWLLQRPDSQDWHLARLYLGPASAEAPLADINGDRRFGRVLNRVRFFGENRDVPVAHPDRFIGRRSVLKRCLRVLRGADHLGVLLHGPGQQGKSSLAARLADRLCVDAKPYRLVVCHGAAQLDARNILEQVERAIQDEPWRLKWQPAWEQDAAAALLPALREVVVAHRLLLVLDDLEQVLLCERDPVIPTPAFSPVLTDVLRAFDGEGASRLILTSRFDFQLPGPQRLHREALSGLAPEERLRLVEGGQIDGPLRPRCLELGLGNPGLSTRLLALAERDPATAARVLDQLQADPRSVTEPAVADFYARVALEALIGLLRPDERELAVAATLFRWPVPASVLEALGRHQGLSSPPAGIERLWALGVLERHADSVQRDRPALLPGELVRSHLPSLDAATAAALRPVALDALEAAWGLVELPPPASLEAYRLALEAGDARRLQTLAGPALRQLEAQHETREAARQGESVLRLVERAGLEVSAGLAMVLFDLHGFADTSGEPDATDLRRVVKSWDGTGDAFTRGALLLRQAEMASTEGDAEGALVLSSQAREAAVEAGDERAAAICAGRVADILEARGQLDEALRIRTEEELPVYQRLGDVHSTAVTMGQIADILEARGQLDEALRIRTEEQLPVYQRLGDVREKAVTMGKIADILQARGQLDEALRIRTEEQLPVYQRLGDVRSTAITMGKIADILQARGQLDEVLRIRTEEQLPVYQRLGDVRSTAITMGKIADILQARGQLDEALRIRTEEEHPVYQRLGDVRSTAVTMGRIADILQARGQLDEALRIRTEEELPVYQRLGDVRSTAVTMGKIADILQARGQLDEALRIRTEEELPVYERLGDVRERAVTLGRIADVLQSRGQLDEALRIRSEEELPVYEGLGDVRSTLVARVNIAINLIIRGRPEDLPSANEHIVWAWRAATNHGFLPLKAQIEQLMQQMGIPVPVE